MLFPHSFIIKFGDLTTVCNVEYSAIEAKIKWRVISITKML